MGEELLSWEELPIKDRAAYIRAGVAEGIHSTEDIKKKYEEFRLANTLSPIRLFQGGGVTENEDPETSFTLGIAEQYSNFMNTPITASNITSYGAPMLGAHHTTTPKLDIGIMGMASLAPITVGTALVGGVPAAALTTGVSLLGGFAGNTLGLAIGSTPELKELYGDIGGLTGGLLGGKVGNNIYPYIDYPIRTLYNWNRVGGANRMTGTDLVTGIKRLTLPGRDRGTVGSLQLKYDADPSTTFIHNFDIPDNGVYTVYLPTLRSDPNGGALFVGQGDTFASEVHFAKSGPHSVAFAADVLSAYPKGSVVAPNGHAVPIWNRLTTLELLTNHLLHPSEWEIPGMIHRNAEVLRGGEYVPPASADALNVAKVGKKIGFEPKQSKVWYLNGVNDHAIKDKVLSPLIDKVRSSKGSKESLKALNDYLVNKLGYKELATYKNGEVRIPFAYLVKKGTYIPEEGPILPKASWIRTPADWDNTLKKQDGGPTNNASKKKPAPTWGLYRNETWANETTKNKRGGYDAKTGLWYPIDSAEGGAATIGPGLKLNEDGKGTSYTPSKAVADKGMTELQLNVFLKNNFTRSLNKVNEYLNDGLTTNPADTVSPLIKLGLMDIRHLVGSLGSFKKLREAILKGDVKAMLENTRTSYYDANEKKRKPDTRRLNIRNSKYFHYAEGGPLEEATRTWSLDGTDELGSYEYVYSPFIDWVYPASNVEDFHYKMGYDKPNTDWLSNMINRDYIWKLYKKTLPEIVVTPDESIPSGISKILERHPDVTPELRDRLLLVYRAAGSPEVKLLDEVPRGTTWRNTRRGITPTIHDSLTIVPTRGIEELVDSAASYNRQRLKDRLMYYSIGNGNDPHYSNGGKLYLQ